MKRARIIAVGILIGAALWIASGYLSRGVTGDAPAKQAAERPLFRVEVREAKLESHQRRITITGRTQSATRVIVSARTSGIIDRLHVKRGAAIKEGERIADLSDEARDALVRQARVRLAQRNAELEAREILAKRGNYPLLNLENLRAEKQAAEAALAQAEAELSRATILAPVSGIVNDVPVEVGQAVAYGAVLAEILVPDPMQALIDLPERRLSGVQLGGEAEVRLVTGETITGRITFIARRPSGATRTYRVDISFPNPSNKIADGIAAEVALRLAAEPAARIPRSALTFSTEGKLGLRIVDAEKIVRFLPVGIVDDEESHLWVSGLSQGQLIITRGQDFIREGQKVQAGPAGTAQ